MTILKLAWRNFSRNRARYRVVILAIVCAIAAMTAVVGTFAGVTGVVRDKASRYFSGHVTVQSYRDTGAGSWIREPAEVEAILAGLPYPVEAIAKRSIYYGTDATLFFAGNYTVQRRLVGIEWDLERPVLNRLDFVAGDVPGSEDTRGILVSQTAAEDLGVRVGDEVTIALTTRLGTQTGRGYRNTGQFVVRGIYEEASFFGYTTYLDRVTLNELQGRTGDEVTEMGVYLRRSALERPVARHIRVELSTVGEVFPVFESRAARDRALRGDWDGRRFAVLTLNAQLAEINDLLSLLGLATTVTALLFLSIVVIGVGNTFTMIVFERTKEVGTLRSLGLTRARTVGLFLGESVIMGAVATGIGLAVGILLLLIARTVPVSEGQGPVSLFLVDGRLSWSLPLGAIAVLVSTGLVSSLSGALRPALRASRMRPVEALQQE
jgi:putative ABC transport system permease protein